MIDIFKNSYNKDAENYDLKFKVLQFIKYKAVLGKNGELIKNLNPVLDFGCGTGLIIDFLKEKNIPTDNIIVVDFAKNMLNIAEKKGMKVKLINGSALPFKDNYFEAVLCFTVLRIIPEQDNLILNEISRVLKPGSYFLLSVLTKNTDKSFDLLLNKNGFYISKKIPCGQDTGYICKLKSS